MPTSAPHPLRIALMGTRGIPARYGGFETFAEELSTRLVERGHAVTVYARCSFGEKAPPRTHRGVTVRSTPTLMHKYAETPLHAATSFLDLFRRTFDIVLLCNAANSPFAFLIKLRGLPLVINVDGIERRRSKWNALGKLWYLLGERCSVLFANRVVADAQVIADYYRERFHTTSSVIAYGASPRSLPPGETLATFNLRPRGYLLYVSRLEPENNALGVVQAYSARKFGVPLVIVGDAPYAGEYIAAVKKAAGPNVIFTGYQFGDAYHELQSNCLLYIQATEVGGTHPALVESMAHGNCVVANGTPENKEVLGDAGEFYPVNNFKALGEVLGRLVENPEAIERHRRNARIRAETLYRWEVITDRYEALFREILQKQR
jgi:glycosyltransferase involved in cell wall biosynthesis